VYAGCIPCQEEGNIPFVIENRVGVYSEAPKTIAQIVASWLAPENAVELKLMSDRAKALGRPEATFNIVRDLAGKKGMTSFSWIDERSDRLTT